MTASCSSTAGSSDEPYVQADRRGQSSVTPARRRCLRGSTSCSATTARSRATPGSGVAAAEEPDRQGVRHLLAPTEALSPLGLSTRPNRPASGLGYHQRLASRPLPRMSRSSRASSNASCVRACRLQGGRHRPRALQGDRGQPAARSGVRRHRDQASGLRARARHSPCGSSSFGVGVERTFPLHSPKIDKIEVAMIGDVNRAKLYYLRGRVGKKARVRELRPDELGRRSGSARSEGHTVDTKSPPSRPGCGAILGACPSAAASASSATTVASAPRSSPARTRQAAAHSPAPRRRGRSARLCRAAWSPCPRARGAERLEAGGARGARAAAPRRC